MNRQTILPTVTLILAVAVHGGDVAAEENSGAHRSATPSPRLVQVWSQVLDLHQIKGEDQVFKADVAVLLKWHQPEFVGRYEATQVVPVEAISWSSLQVVNDSGVDTKLAEVVQIDPDGTVVYRQRYLGEFSTSMDLHDFPIDSQQLGIRFGVPGKSPQDIDFSCADGEHGLTSGPTIADWRVKGVSCRRESVDFEVLDISLAGFAVVIDIERRVGFYLGKAFASVAIIVLMSWLVFWFAPSQLTPRVSISVTSMLTLIAYRFLLGQELPLVPYQTRLDIFLLGSTVLILLALVEVVAVEALESGGNNHIGTRLNFHSRWAFPAAFAVLFVMVFLA